MPHFLDVESKILSGGSQAANTGQSLLLSTRASAPTDYTDAQVLRRLLGFTTHASSSTIEDAGLTDAADIYFGQDPYPQNLVIGYRYDAATSHVAIGGTPGSVSDISSLGATAQSGLVINGVRSTTALDLSAVTSYDTGNDQTDAANQLTAGINALSTMSGMTVAYDSDANVFIVYGSSSFGAGFSGAVAEAYGLNKATIYPAISANETPSAALNRLENAGASFNWVVPSEDIVTNGNASTWIRSMANWVNARSKNMIFDSYGADVLVSDEDTSVDAVISALKQNNVGAIYNGAVIDHKGLGYTAIFSAVNYEGANTVVSGSHKTIQGTTPVKLTEDQRAELERKRINYYEAQGGFNFTRAGWTFGTWIDSSAFANWFNQRAKDEVIRTLLRRDVNQIDSDSAVLQAIESVCELAVNNGAIGAGFAQPDMLSDIRTTIGNADFNAFLPNGYYVWKASYADQTISQREARDSVPYYVWLIGRGFVNNVDIKITLQP